MKWVTLRETYPSLVAHSAKTSGAPSAHSERFERRGLGTSIWAFMALSVIPVEFFRLSRVALSLTPGLVCRQHIVLAICASPRAPSGPGECAAPGQCAALRKGRAAVHGAWSRIRLIACADRSGFTKNPAAGLSAISSA
jgi:hypothetical protein